MYPPTPIHIFHQYLATTHGYHGYCCLSFSHQRLRLLTIVNVPWRVSLIPPMFLYPTSPTLPWSNMKELIHLHSLLGIFLLVGTSNSSEYVTVLQLKEVHVPIFAGMPAA